MDHQTIRILVVDDEPQWNGMIINLLLRHLADAAPGAPRLLFIQSGDAFRTQVRAVLDQPYDDAAEVEQATILTVNELEDAVRLIVTLPSVDLVTMAMELGGALAQTIEKEGLHLLKLLAEKHPDVVSMVVSGRAGEMDVVRRSIAHYGAVDALEKGSDPNAISDSLRAALLLAEARRLMRLQSSGARIQAERGLHEVARMAEATREIFRKQFSDFLRDLDAFELDEVTGLLNANIITDHARGLLKSDAPWMLGMILIDGLAAFEIAYGSFERMNVVKIVSQQLRHIAQSSANTDILRLGYLGDGKFVVIGLVRTELERILRGLQSWFIERSGTFYSQISEGKPRGILSLRLVMKDHTQGIVAIDQMFALSGDGGSIETSW